MPEPHQLIDPGKWYFDQQTGNYFRKTTQFKNGAFLHSTETYQEILTKRLFAQAAIGQYLRRMAASIGTAFISWLILQSIDWDPHTASVGKLAAYVVFGMVILTCTVIACGLGGRVIQSYYELIHDVHFELPPFPVAPRGSEDVRKQKVHGKGGFDTPDDIKRPSQGKPSGLALHQTFDD